jgi:(p)ppGpp synthase/HD superfamily hydrolase
MEVGGRGSLQETHPPPEAPLGIRGTEGMVVTFAKCCRPIPGDSIVGTFTKGKGIVIHTAQCRNLGEFRRQPERWIEVSWEGVLHRDFPAELRLEAVNRRGVLAQLAAEISHLGSNIEHMVVEERDEHVSTMDFVLCVRDRVHLARIIKRLRAQPTVLRVMRPRG